MQNILLAPADIERFGKLLGMLGSDHDGERAAAAAMATRFLQQRGLSWSEFVSSVLAVPSLGTSAPLPHRSTARECLAIVGIWTAKELSFLRNMEIRRQAPTPGQAEWLADLHLRVQPERRAA